LVEEVLIERGIIVFYETIHRGQEVRVRLCLAPSSHAATPD